MAEHFHEPLEARIPEPFIAAEPAIGALERPRIDAAIVNAPADGALYESGPLEGLDVLRRRGEGHPVRRGKLADGLLAPGEALEHGPPRRVAEGMEDVVESP